MPGGPRKQRFEFVKGTKRDAEGRLRELITAERNGAFEFDDKILFNELAELFLAERKISKEATTHRLYERVLKQHVLPFIGKVKARDVKPAHVISLLGSAVNRSRTKSRGTRLSPRTLRNVRTYVHAVLEFGVKHGVLVRNVCDLVEAPAMPLVERPSIDTEQVTRLVSAARGTEIESVIAFAIGTGLRRSEICALKWSDVNLSTGQYSIKRAAKIVDGKVIIGNLKTKKSARTDVLPAFVLSLLQQYRLSQTEHRRPLASANPNPTTSFS